MSKPLVVTIPGTPDKCLSPNKVRKTHWGTRGRATAQMRGTAKMATREAVGPAPAITPPLTLHAVIAWEHGKRKLDPDNAHGILKSVIDGIADALEVNDKHITLASVTQEVDEERLGYVKVAIEENTNG